MAGEKATSKPFKGGFKAKRPYPSKEDPSKKRKRLPLWRNSCTWLGDDLNYPDDAKSVLIPSLRKSAILKAFYRPAYAITHVI
jgi:hypothetical protein